MPLVSVIIPTYQSAAYLPGAIDSVLAQTITDFEIIIVDDGSTDETSKVLDAYKQAIIAIQQTNQGPSAARNKGIQQAKGKFIAFLDSDDLWFPYKLEKQLSLFAQNTDLGLVFGNAEYFMDDHTYNRTSFSVIPPARGRIIKPLFANNFIPTSTVMILREVFDDLPTWFNPGFPTCEDYDLWLRISETRPIDYISEAFVKYRISNQQLTSNKIRMVDNLIKVRKAALSRPLTSTQIPPSLRYSVYLRLYLVMARIRLSQANQQAAQQQLRLYAQEGGRSLNAHLLWLLTYMPVQPISRVLSYLEQRHSQRGRWMSSLDK